MKIKILLFAVLLLSLAGCGQYTLLSDAESAKESAASEAEEAAVSEASSEPEAQETKALLQEMPTELCVYVVGAVASPGVYKLPAGSRVFQAIEAAGGLLEEAEARAVNQAEVLVDGQQITVPTVEEAAVAAESPAGAAGGTQLVDLNKADAQALMSLPGIGESKAAAIIAYREANGGFSSIEQIMEVEGIKEGSFSKIKDLITVS